MSPKPPSPASSELFQQILTDLINLEHHLVKFAELIGYLAKKNKLKRALTVGIAQIDTRGGMLDIAVKSVKQRQKLTMYKQVAFADDFYTLDVYLDKLHQHLLEANTAVIINITGRLEHWTCVKEVTPDWLVLADSAGIKQLKRQLCNIGIEEKGMYTLWPSMTYLLSLKSVTSIEAHQQ